MHYGEAKTRSIYGEASLEEARRCMRKESPPCRCRCCPRITTDEASYKRAS